MRGPHFDTQILPHTFRRTITCSRNPCRKQKCHLYSYAMSHMWKAHVAHMRGPHFDTHILPHTFYHTHVVARWLAVWECCICEYHYMRGHIFTPHVWLRTLTRWGPDFVTHILSHTLWLSHFVTDIFSHKVWLTQWHAAARCVRSHGLRFRIYGGLGWFKMIGFRKNHLVPHPV